MHFFSLNVGFSPCVKLDDGHGSQEMPIHSQPSFSHKPAFLLPKVTSYLLSFLKNDNNKNFE